MARDVLITPTSGLIDFLDSSTSKATLTLGTDGILVLTGGSNPIVIETSTSGSSALRVDGTNGTLFEVVDDLSDSLMSVNDAAGLPVLEVFADNHIVAGRYNQNDFYLDTNGNLGLGTASPAKKLDVSGSSPTIRITDTTDPVGDAVTIGKLEFYGTDGSSGGADVRSYISTISENASGNAYRLAFGTSTSNAAPTEKLTILNNGNVGIGTASPASLLHLSSSSNPTLTLTDTGTSGNNTTAGIIQFQALDSASNNDTFAQIYGNVDVYTSTEEVGQLNFKTMQSGTISDAMVIQGSKVGIGTSAPTYLLTVAGDMGVDQKIYHNGDANTYLNFLNDRFKINVGGIVYLDCDDSTTAPHNMTVNDGGNNVDFIIKGNGSNQGDPLFKTDASTGRVGINGVGSPEAELEVDGTIIATGSDPHIGIGTTGPGATLDVRGDVRLDSGGSTDRTIYFRNQDSSTTVGGAIKSDQYLSLWAGNESGTPTQYLTIKPAGNVGIGTASPAELLEVYGTEASGSVELLLTNVGDGGSSTTPYTAIRSRLNTIRNGGEIRFGRDSNYGSASNADSNMQFYTALDDTNTERMRITSAGNVGIGTGSPSYKLHVNGGGARIEDGETTLSPDSTGNSGTSSRALTIMNLVDSGWTTDALAAYNNTTSYDILDRASYSFFARPKNTNIFTSANENSGTANLQRYVNLNSSSTEPLLEWAFYQYSGTGTTSSNFQTPDKLFRIIAREGSSNNTKFLIKGNGNVGIGTASPDSGLTIAKSQTSAHAYTTNHLHLATPATSNNGGATTISFATSTVDNYGWSLAAIRETTNGYDTRFAFKSHNNSDSGSEVLSVLADGNVGIGTTNPYAKLQVNGTTQTFNAHFGQGQNNSSGHWGGISLGYSENNNNYRKVGIVAKAIGDNAARQELHFLVDSVSDACNATLTDSKMMIDISGNVGIGTTNPSEKLHVVGTIKAGGNSEAFISNTPSSNSQGYIRMSDNSGSNKLIELNSVDYAGIISGGTISLGVGVTSYAILSGTTANGGDLTLKNSSASPTITLDGSAGSITTTGKATIGTIDTDATLTDFIVVDSNGELHKRTGGSGTSGTSGTSGQSGTSGTSGDSGTSGTSGDSGTSGSSGNDGTDASVGGSNNQYVYRTGSTSVTSGCLCHATNKVVVNQGAEFKVTGPAASYNTHFNYNNGGANYITSCGACTFIRGYNGSSVSNGLVASATGAVGVGGNPSSQALKIHGTTCATQEITSSSYICTCGDFCTDGDVCCTSDARFKTDVAPIKPIGGLACTIMSMRGVEYKWKNDSPAVKADPEKINRCNLGFIAQEVEKAIPSAVSCGKGEYFEDERKISTGGILAMLLELVKEHQLKIEQLENKVSELENRVNILGQCVTE